MVSMVAISVGNARRGWGGEIKRFFGSAVAGKSFVIFEGGINCHREATLWQVEAE